jgi:ribonucleotide reductase alpha subunit
MKDLMKLGLWSEQLKQEIVARNGSIQGISVIPEELQLVYKTSWELKQRTLIDMAAARGAFICQSQSLNLFVADPTYSKLTSMHFYAWKCGLKTGCYYLRTKAPVAAQKFTIDPRLLSAVQNGGNTNTVHEDDKDSYESDSDDDSDDEKMPVPVAPKATKEERAALLEKLAKEYDEAQGEGCLMCSS